jgi:hypothetical protein
LPLTAAISASLQLPGEFCGLGGEWPVADLSFHLRSSADALCTNAMQMNQLKIWINDFLQNAGFHAIVLAFACAPVKNEIVDVSTGRFTDHVRAAKPQTRHIDSHEQGRMVPAGEKSCLETGSPNLTV